MTPQYHPSHYSSGARTPVKFHFGCCCLPKTNCHLRGHPIVIRVHEFSHVGILVHNFLDFTRPNNEGTLIAAPGAGRAPQLKVECIQPKP
jgi:hypothetical protein